MPADLPGQGAVKLSVIERGNAASPALLFLHGFPEAAFVWEPLLDHFADRFHAVAPNLRGFADSPSPPEVGAYRARHLVADIAALVDRLGAPLEALVAHDWGGALAWNFAAEHPDKLKRLVIINAPHPVIFLRELQTNPAQQAASAYMNFLRRPDAPRLLAENDFARLWPFFTNMGADAWFTDALRERYRTVWRQGLTGACNYYRASPLHPPTASDDAVLQLRLPPELATVRVPTTVLWGDADSALLPGLLDGLAAFVPDLRVVHVPKATHWIVHEQPERVAAEVERALCA